ARTFAKWWGSDVEILPQAGHINSDSGHNQWVEGLGFLARLAQQTRRARSAYSKEVCGPKRCRSRATHITLPLPLPQPVLHQLARFIAWQGIAIAAQFIQVPTLGGINNRKR